MNLKVSCTFVFFAAYIIAYGSYPARAATTSEAQHELNRTNTAAWTSSSAQHLYGLPDTKPNDRGTLSLNAEGLRFAGKSADFFVPWHSIIALSAGNEEVELWGNKGRILRMLIPFSGGLAVATVMHHRVDELTVEFTDNKGGYHGAVFILPPHEAQRALHSSGRVAYLPHEFVDLGCKGQPVQRGSVLVEVLTPPQSDVPAAYRVLVYEHLIDRLRHLQGVRLVYRQGQRTDQKSCPQFVVRGVLAAFQPGNQVLRASTGPVGMFVAPTELKMNATFSDASTGRSTYQHLKSTVRDDSESRKVAEKAARIFAKHFSSDSKELQKSRPGESSQASLNRNVCK